MKTVIFLLCAVLTATFAAGQNPIPASGQVTPPRLMANYPSTIVDYLKDNVKYPEPEKGIQGTVVLGFVVTSEGRIRDIEVINKVYYKHDKEVIRALKTTSGKWQPAFLNGQPVDMQQEIAFSFKIFPNVDFEEKAKILTEKANKAFYIDNKPNKALRLYDLAVTYHPYDQSLMEMRAFCKNKMGDLAGADNDWNRANVLAGMYEKDIPLITKIATGEKSKVVAGNSSEKSMGK